MFDKLKELTKDTAVYGISTMIGRFLTFLLVPFYTNIFLPEQYGVIANLYSFIAILNIFFIYGMDAAYLKFAAQPVMGDEKDNFSTPYIAVAAVGVVLAFLVIGLKMPILYLFDIPAKYSYLIYYVAPIVFIDAVCVIPFIKLRLERKAKKFALFKIINIVVNVALNLFLILKLGWGIEAVLISNVIASLASFVLLFPSVLKSIKFSVHTELLKRLLKFGLPYMPAGLGAMLIQGIDRPILSHLTNLDIAGIYNANYKLGIFMMLFVNMFQYAWQPFFLQNAEEKNAKEMFAKVLTYFTLAGGIILIVISLFIPDLVKLEIFGRHIIGPEYWGGLNIVPVILFAYLFNGIYVIFTAGIFIKEKSIYVPLMTGSGAIVNVAVNFALIPSLGIMGAAFATLASYLVMAAGYFIVTQKFYKIDYEYSKVMKIFISIFIVGAIYYILLNSGHLTLLNKSLLLVLFFMWLLIFNIGKEEILFLKRRFFSSNS